MFFLHIVGVIDSSGLDVILTKTKRQYDIGMLTVGHSVHSFFRQLIPPFAKEFKYYGHCETCGPMVSVLLFIKSREISFLITSFAQ